LGLSAGVVLNTRPSQGSTGGETAEKRAKYVTCAISQKLLVYVYLVSVLFREEVTQREVYRIDDHRYDEALQDDIFEYEKRGEARSWKTFR
jgi:hypothetical protein